MENLKELEILINDVIGTIILIVEDEGEFKENITEFIEKNYNLFVLENKLNISIKDIREKNIALIVNMRLMSEGYSVEAIGDETCIKLKAKK